MLVYLHVPFCARRCSYCDFAIAVRRETPSAAYADLVLAEWRRRLSSPGWAESLAVETIYFGGGTPSRLDPAALARILSAIRADRDLVPGAEVTLEANPDDVTAGAVGAWLEAGITRVSLGAQSFDSRVLRWMHRTHTAAQIVEAVATLRQAGVRHLSLDLIFGLPTALERDWPADLEQALALGPEHLSFYGLTIEPGTPLARWVREGRGRVSPIADEAAAEEYLTAHRAVGGAGYRHYEVSSAARPGFVARHNAGYWTREPYLGLGPSAHGAHGARRWWNQREWEAYRRAVARGEDPTAGSELLTDAQQRLEESYLGLRWEAGCREALIPPATRDGWVERGWAQVEGGRVRLTVEGWLRLDALVPSLPAESLDCYECRPAPRSATASAPSSRP